MPLNLNAKISFERAVLKSSGLACLMFFFFAGWSGSTPCHAAPSAAALERRSDTQPLTEQDLRQRQIQFLNQIRTADPEHRTIERAIFNDRNELGLILNRNIELDKIPALMKTLLTRMARTFPAQDLTILAYTPSNPPRKIGTARLNASTRDMTYTPER